MDVGRIMKAVRCPKCSKVIATEEDNRIMVRVGFGNHRLYHSFMKDGAVLTCWYCKEVVDINNRGKKNV